MQFVSNYENVYTRNYNWNCRLKNDDHFVSVSMCFLINTPMDLRMTHPKWPVHGVNFVVTGGTGVWHDDKFRCPAGTSDYRVDIMLTLRYEKCLRRHTVEYLIIRDIPHIHELRYSIDPCGKVLMLSSGGYHWRNHPLKHVCEQSMYISFKNWFIFSIKIVARFKIGCVHC